MSVKPVTLLDEALRLGQLRHESKLWKEKNQGKEPDKEEEKRREEIAQLERSFPDDDYENCYI